MTFHRDRTIAHLIFGESLQNVFFSPFASQRQRMFIDAIGLNSVQVLARLGSPDDKKCTSTDAGPVEQDDYDAMENGTLTTLHDVVFDVIKAGPEKVAQLMDIEGMMQYKDVNGHDVLTIAARMGMLEVVKYLIKSRKMSPAVASTKDGSTALHWSVIKGHQDITTWLIS